MDTSTIFEKKENPNIPTLAPGDTVKVSAKIAERGKERIQVFQGLVIRRRGGGVGETFTVRKISYGEGVERVFPVHSPNIESIEVKRRGKVRRAKLYYLRDLSGKKARLHSKVRDLSGLISEEEAEAIANGEGVEPAASETVVEETQAPEEEQATETGGKKLKGKALKKAKAAEKVKRMEQLRAEEAERAARKEAEAAAAAKAEAEASEATEGEAPAE